MQNGLFATLSPTWGSPVRTIMILSFVSCVDWHFMGKRDTSLYNPRPALFLCCNTSNFIAIRMGTIISSQLSPK